MKMKVQNKPSHTAIKHKNNNTQPVPERKLDNGVIGGIIGDVCASVYNPQNIGFGVPISPKLDDGRSVFTGATVLSVATMDAMLKLGNEVSHTDFSEMYHKYIQQWLNVESSLQPQGCCRSGSLEAYYAMGTDIAVSVGSIGWLPVSGIYEVEGIAHRTSCWRDYNTFMMARSIAAAVYSARNTNSKNDLKSQLETSFGYNLSCAPGDIRPSSYTDTRCETTVVHLGLVAFLESDNFEHAIKLAIESGCRFNASYGRRGDFHPINISQLACITGTVAGAYYKEVPEYLLLFVCYKILAFSDTIKAFIGKAGVHSNLSVFLSPDMEQQNTLEWLYGPRQK